MSRLPDGFVVRLDPRLRSTADGLLVGGSPLTALRLAPAARRLLDGDAVTVVDTGSSRVAERLLATNLGQPDTSGLPRVDPEELTVVIPVRDRAEQLDRTLAALAPLSCLVVDDGSRERFAVASVAHTHGAALMVLQGNRGPAAARNAGARNVTTRLVAFVDSDVEVSSTGLLALARHFADPRVALVAPRVDGVVRSSRPHWFERYDAVASSLTVGNRPSNVGPGRAVAWLPSACLVARTEVVVDAFDEGMRLGEDVDLVWRLVGTGHRVRFDPDVTAHHDSRATLCGWLGRKVAYGTSSADLARRHGSHVAPAVLTPTFAVAAGALLLKRSASAPVAAVAIAVTTRRVARALPATSGGGWLAMELAGRGLGQAVQQEAALLLRHWWPATALGLLLSRHVRRAAATALVVDTAAVLVEHCGRDERANPVVLVVGRRLDDAAYGLGLWAGAWRRRSWKALLPRRPRSAA